MPKGTWSEKNKPTLAGIYNRFLTKAKETITGGTHGVLGMPVKANWGEIGKVIEVNSFADLAEIFGKDSTYSAYKLGRLAFLGKPEKLLLYRVADESAAYGTVSLQNTESSDAITLKTKYKSSRNFNITSAANIVDDGAIDIVLYEGTVELNRVEQVENNLDKIIEAINLNFEEIVATKASNATGKLATVTNVKFTSGNDGCSAITVEHYTKAMRELSKYNIDGFTLDGVADRSIQTALKEWAQELKENGSDVLVFVGGDSTIAEANSASLNFDDSNITNVGTGCTYQGINYTAAEVAVYVAALVLGLTIKESLCYRKTIFDDVTTKLERKEMKQALAKGTLVLIKEDDDVIILDDKNTYTSYTETKNDVFGEIRGQRFVNIVNQDTLVKNKDFIGNITDSEDDKITLICALKKYFETLEKEKVLTDFIVEIDDSIPESLREDDAIFWRWDAKYVKVKKRIFGTGYIR